MIASSQPRPRLLVCEYDCARPESLRAALPEAGFDVDFCATPELLVERSLQRAPHVILCRLCAACQVNTGVVRLLRRLHPRTPIVLLSERASLDAQRLVQEFRPIHFLLEPLDPSELNHIAQASISNRAKFDSIRL